MAMQPFMWGRGGQALTPDQVERLRMSSALAAERGSDTSPVAHWSQGLARMVDAWGGYRGNMRANTAEEAGLASADEAIKGNPVLAALLGGDQAGMAQPSPVMNTSTSPVAAALVDGGLPASLVQSESGGNWNALNSEGYGGRGQFGEARLADAARAGIIPAGMTGADYSRAPEQVQLAVENWHKQDILNSLGKYVGADIDGPGPIPPLTSDSILAVAHLGGTGGAQKFIESGGAYNPSDSNGTSLSDYAMRHAGGASGGASVMPAAMTTQTGPSPVLAALAQAQGNPWVAQKYGPVIQALMGQEMQRSNAAYEAQLKQQDPMYQAQLQAQQLELEQMRQPAAPVFEGGQWWSLDGGQPQALTQATPEQTAAMQNYDFLIAQGVDPAIAQQRAFGGGVNVEVNTGSEVGTIPQGFELFTDPQTGARSMRPIAGGPEDTSKQTAAKAEAAQTSGDVILNAANRAREAASGRALGGVGQGLGQMLPWTDAAEVKRQVAVLKSNATIEALNAMRQQSPTGGALGNVTEGEGQMLAAKAGALDPSSPNFARDLADYTRTLLQTVHGRDAGEKLFTEQWSGGAQSVDASDDDLLRKYGG